MVQYAFEKNLLITEQLETKDGYTYTLASRLGNMLSMAEQMFGERDRTYTILGTEFYDGVPQLWYPGNCKNIVIQLNKDTLNNEHQAYYQLAHESIHLLSPTGGNHSNVLEEGLATYFSQLYMDTFFPGEGWHANDERYSNACELIKKVLSVDPKIIKKLRKNQPVISKIKKEELLNEGIEEKLAEELTKKFQ